MSLWSSVPFGSCVARPVRYSLFKELKFLYKSTGSGAPSGHVTVNKSKKVLSTLVMMAGITAEIKH